MTQPIQLQHLTTGYKRKLVTRDINAQLNAGELTCLLGPNGAGKSTLLKTLCAFIPPIEGEICINGVNISAMRAKQLAQTISVVLTERPSGMNMTVDQLVAIGRSPYTSFFGSLRAEDKAVVDKAMRLVSIDALRDRLVHTLSDGERQKAMIAKALAQETQIIFLDEPTAYLDYPSKVDIMKLLYRIAKEEGKTVFMSTHDIELAMQISDKIWLLDKKLGLKIGIPEDLAYDGSMERYFQRGGLKFDRATGSFEIVHDIVGGCCLRGEGCLRNMAEKALRRNGFSTDENDSHNIVEVATLPDGSEELLHNGKKMNNIEELIDSIKIQ